MEEEGLADQKASIYVSITAYPALGGAGGYVSDCFCWMRVLVLLCQLLASQRVQLPPRTIGLAEMEVTAYLRLNYKVKFGK